MVLVEWLVEHPVRHTHDVVSEWLPLVPNVRSLKQRGDQPLGLNKHHLGRSDLGFHDFLTLPLRPD